MLLNNTKRYKNYYGIEDFSNDKNFDLVVDTKVNNAQKVVEIIMKELELRKII